MALGAVSQAIFNFCNVLIFVMY